MTTRPRKRGFWALAVTALLLPVLAFVGGFASPVEAAPAPIPTPFTAVGSGGVLTLNDTALEPTSLNIPHPARSPECSNGEDDESGERIVSGSPAPATDGLIDHPADGQCSSTADNSELAANPSGMVPNPQPKTSAVFSGTRSGSTVTISSSTFPKGYLGAATTDTVTAWWIVEAGLNITSTSGVSNADGSGTLGITGAIDAKYARQSCSGFLCFGAPNNGTCTGNSSTINFTTETSGGLTGERYDDVDQTMVIVSDGFTTGTIATSNALCDALETQLGAGSANNQGVISLSFAPIAGCGTSPNFNTAAPCWEPTVVGSAPAAAGTGDTVTLDGSGSYDPGYTGEFISPNIQYSQLSTFTWSQISGPAALPTPTGGNNAEVTFPSAGTYEYQIEATGNPYYAGPLTDTVSIVVTDPVTQGDISGTITDGVNPVPGARVNLYDGVATGRIATTTADGSGNYSFVDLDTGDYRVRAYTTDGLNVPTWFDGKANAATANMVTVTAGGNTVADIAMPEASRLTGRLRNWNFANPPPVAAGVPVRLYAASGGLLQITSTNANGWYDFRALPAGSYKLSFGDDTTTAVEWLGGTPDPGAQFGSDSQVVNTTAGVTTVIDYTRVTPVSIPEYSGTVYESDGTTPIAGATVNLYTTFGRVHTATTDVNGEWAAYGVFDPGTNYYGLAFAAGFEQDWWDNAGPVMNDCSGQPTPCDPSLYYADHLVFAGGAQRTMNFTLDVL